MSEHGDRASFLERIRERQGPAPVVGPHPPPSPPDTVPVMGYRSLDGDADLVEVFIRAAREAEATVDIAPGAGVAERLAEIVEAYAVERAVVSVEAEAVRAGGLLSDLGVEVASYSPEAAAVADLGVTSATHGLASTGSLVVDSSTAGSRAVSLLPRVHLCLLPADRIVPSHADVLRHQSRPMPSCRVVITGPSRTGDIEQRLTLGAHGPVALHILLLDP